MKRKPKTSATFKGKKHAVLILLLLVLLLSPKFLTTGTASVSTAHFRETFTSLQDGAGAQYYNVHHGPLALERWIPVGNVLPVQLKNGYAKGGVRYQVQNAQHISVSIVTYGGTMVSSQDDGYGLGVQQFVTPFVGIINQGQYSPTTQQVYTHQRNKRYQAKFQGSRFLFYEEEQIPKDTVPFGVHVQTSSDGISYRTLALQHTEGQVNPHSSLVLETFGAPVPENTTHIKVEINQCNQLWDIDGNTAPLRPAYRTHLTGVEISGKTMIFGPPEELQTESEITTPPVQSSEESTGNTKESQQKEKKRGSQRRTVEVQEDYLSEKELSSAPESAEKFEGTLEPSGAPAPAPEKKGGTAGKKATGTPKDSSGEKVIGRADDPTADPSASVEESQPEPQRYLVEATGQDTPLLTGVTFYIVIASGFILFLLLRPKK